MKMENMASGAKRTYWPLCTHNLMQPCTQTHRNTAFSYPHSVRRMWYTPDPFKVFIPQSKCSHKNVIGCIKKCWVGFFNQLFKTTTQKMNIFLLLIVIFSCAGFLNIFFNFSFAGIARNKRTMSFWCISLSAELYSEPRHSFVFLTFCKAQFVHNSVSTQTLLIFMKYFDL